MAQFYRRRKVIEKMSPFSLGKKSQKKTITILGRTKKSQINVRFLTRTDVTGITSQKKEKISHRKKLHHPVFIAI